MHCLIGARLALLASFCEPLSRKSSALRRASRSCLDRRQNCARGQLRRVAGSGRRLATAPTSRSIDRSIRNSSSIVVRCPLEARRLCRLLSFGRAKQRVFCRASCLSPFHSAFAAQPTNGASELHLAANNRANKRKLVDLNANFLRAPLSCICAHCSLFAICSLQLANGAKREASAICVVAVLL